MNSIFAKILKFLIQAPVVPTTPPTGPAVPPTNDIPISPSEEFGTRVCHEQPAVINSKGFPTKMEVAQETASGPRYYVKRFFHLSSFGEHTDLSGIGGQCQYPGCNGYGLKSRMGYCAKCKRYFCPSHLEELDDGSGDKKYCLTCFPEVWKKANTWRLRQKAEEEAKKMDAQ
ncbi:MAG: hypothetical protein A2021_03770 [Elusimicrobia bacterium GWF2_52_66]|nr:MAG: hypothetical protein A2X33_10055 [Elusimicrobia bacterium GWA2_51_34]OGR84706.1 MAG: hypothetical protein A2021_03770 [Elusimicrobia bacterium GWF2_52_66]